MTDGPGSVIRIPTGFWQRVILTVVGAVFLLLAVVELTIGAWGARILGVAIGVPSVVMIYRSPRLGVVVDDGGITNRSLERTRRIPWCDIASVEPARAGSAAPSTTLALTTEGGERIVLDSLAGYATTDGAARLERTRARIEAVLAAHRTGCADCAHAAPV
ncbi:PH domain-containing protein [Kitasatospora xanthocidica]|uniref:PH domain-containing protein n=1 Tax=Kitasatospora xanthocidica TaxID=83382 RepID=UPI0016740F7A|nr:PH domain-containing protein [Kitasatospora xanthocidica]